MTVSQETEKSTPQRVIEACDVIWHEKKRWPRYQEIKDETKGGSDVVTRVFNEWTEAKLAQLFALEAGIPKIYYDAFNAIRKQVGKEAAARVNEERAAITETAEREVAAAQQRAQLAQDKAQALSAEVAELKHRVFSADEKVSALTVQLNSERGRLKFAEKELASSVESRNAEASRYEKVIAELKVSLASTIADARADKARDDQRYAALEGRLEKQGAEFSAQLQGSVQLAEKNATNAEEWRGRHEQLTAQLEILKRDLTAAHMRVEIQTNELSKAQQAAAEARTQAKDFQERIANMQSSIDSSAATIVELRNELATAVRAAHDASRWQVEAETLRAVLTAQQSATPVRNKHN